MKIHDLITDTDTLADLCERLAKSDFVTVDTEFMRENTYWPELCLVQIANEEEAAAIDGITVFHAGTKAVDGKVLASGGRVLGVTSLGQDVARAQSRAYEAVDKIDWPEGFCRRDIGWRAIDR